VSRAAAALSAALDGSIVPPKNVRTRGRLAVTQVCVLTSATTREGTRPDKSPILPPMVLYVPGWSQMTDADADALAKFVKALPPIEHKVPKSDFKPAGPPPGAGPPPPAPPQ
jgi:hypothetical protein